MHALFAEAGPAHMTSEPSQIPNKRLATTQLPARLQLAAWQAALAPIVDVTSPAPPGDGFAARMVAWSLGRLTLMRCQLPPGGFVRHERHLDDLTSHYWCLLLPLDGTLTVETKGGRHTISAGRMGIYSMRQPLSGTHTATTLLAVMVPRNICPEAPAIIERAVNTILRSNFAGFLADFFIDLEARLPTMPARHLPAIIEASRAMILSCVAQDRDEAAPTLHDTLFERARSYIRRNLNEPDLSVEDLCRELRLSRSSLYRLFEARGGVVQYIRSCRLLDAHRAFETGRDLRRIQEIAVDSGFHDPAAFSRAFKRKFGYSPSEVRGKPGSHTLGGW